MPSLEWNRNWNSSSELEDTKGECWSAPWHSSESQWFGSLFPRLHRVLPARRVLEIAPGYGRWTKYLLNYCESYIGVDFNESCVDFCQKEFREAKNTQFIVNDGVSLEAAPNGAIDFVFSFDSLVHVEIDVLQGYIGQIVKKLAPNGVAFLHHSNLAAEYLPKDLATHGRSETVSADIVARLVERFGGKILVQEVITWSTSGMIDGLTMFDRADSSRRVPGTFSRKWTSIGFSTPGIRPQNSSATTGPGCRSCT